VSSGKYFLVRKNPGKWAFPEESEIIPKILTP
jgi:hypothetical protein